MPNTFIIGGHGKVARQLILVLREEVKPRHTVISMIRNESQADEIRKLGGEPLVHSLEETSSSELAKVIKASNASAVVFSAGAGGGNPQRTDAVDHLGAIKTFDAVVEAGVSRFIMVSAIDIRNRESKPVPSWYGKGDKDVSDRVWGAIQPYMEAKFKADRDLRVNNSKRGLRYTIVRPGHLSDEPGKNTVVAGKVSIETSVSRQDVARVVAECLENAAIVGLAFDLCGGTDTTAKPIREAIEEVAANKVDTFEGFY